MRAGREEEKEEDKQPGPAERIDKDGTSALKVVAAAAAGKGPLCG